MPAHRVICTGLAALFVGSIAPAALAQQDVQVTSEAISRACAEIHKTPQVQVEAPSVRGPNDITLNCRLIGAAGATIAQVSPAEVCQRLNGSTEWYRGMGTQVFCRAGSTATPAPRSFTINDDDIAKACQRVHGNPQATADPTAIGPSGLELNCRLTNQDGVTLARVSPEDVCEAKFGTREWMGVFGSKTFVCKGTPTDTARPNQAPAADRAPVADNARNDVPLTHEAMTKACRILHGAEATATALSYAPRNSNMVGWHEPVINCSAAGGIVAHRASEACPKLSGTADWYTTDFGRGTWMPGESTAAAPRIPVCRGPGPLQYHALADMGRYCEKRGYRHGNHGITASLGTGRQVPPVCFNNHMALAPVAIEDVCREVHRAGAYEVRGAMHFCLPQGAPPAPLAVAEKPPAPAASLCPDCGPLMEAIGYYEGRIKEQDRRIAAQEAYIRSHEEGAKTRRGREREAWQDIARAAAARLAGTKELRARMEAELEARKSQLSERLGRCTEDACREVVTSVRPDLAPPRPAAPGPTTTTERPPVQPTERPPGQTTERPPAQTTTADSSSRPDPVMPERTAVTPPVTDPARASTSSASKCPRHEAELTNGERVFHRLYVRGYAKSSEERASWMRQLARIKSGLEAPGRQAPGSTTRTIEEPSVLEFFDAIGQLQAKAQPCEEVTIYIEAHGGLGKERNKDDEAFRKTEEPKGEFLVLNSSTHIQDLGLGPLLKNFRPNVSVSVIVDSCFGGGFAGKGNIEESRLVQVIGLYTICVVLVDAINQGIDGAMKGPNNRATTAEVKDHMLSKGWPLGEPSDNETDEFLHRPENLPRILPGYVPPPAQR